MRGEQFQTFDLTKVSPLSKREEIQQFRHIVPPATALDRGMPMGKVVQLTGLRNRDSLRGRMLEWRRSLSE